MKFIFKNRPNVTADIELIVAYYKNINPELAHNFLHKIDEANQYINDFSEAFQIKYKNVRCITLKIFPYQIHYIIDKVKNQIIILAIIHSYKNPNDFSKF